MLRFSILAILVLSLLSVSSISFPPQEDPGDETCYCHIYKSSCSGNFCITPTGKQLQTMGSFKETVLMPKKVCNAAGGKVVMTNSGNTQTYILHIYGGALITKELVSKFEKDMTTKLNAKLTKELKLTRDSVAMQVLAFEQKMQEQLIQSMNNVPNVMLANEFMLEMKKQIVADVLKELENEE